MDKKQKLLRNNGFQTVLVSLICIIIGLIIGFVVLLIISPAGAGKAITAILKNFFYYPNAAAATKYFGTTLIKASALLMCALSVIFAYKVGLFNIGASGQYAVGAGFALYFGIHYGAPWWLCLLLAMLGGAALGAIAGALKAYLNVNEVIACIMLNWISLYAVNTVLTEVKESGTTYTLPLRTNNPNALIPHLGLQHLFADNRYVTIAIPLAVIFAILVWVVLDKTKLGYELKATGLSINAAKYAGMREKKNIILTMAISGALAGLGAGFLYLCGIEQWSCAQTAVPNMGFNGIAAAFLGGIHPIGVIFSSFFIQHITSGGAYVDKMVYCSQISDLIAAIIIYFCGFVLFFKHVMRTRIRKTEDKKVKSADKKGGE